MSIRTRLLVSLLAIVAIPGLTLGFINIHAAENALQSSISDRVQSIARQGANTIDAIFSERISEARGLALNQAVISAVRKSNAAFSRLPPAVVERTIKKVDLAWIADRNNSAIARQIHTSPLSAFLRRYQDTNPDKYGEIFVTNARGAAVAMTKILSDYNQADETWWTASYSNGKGDLFLDDRGYDLSVDALVTGVVVPVMDDGSAIGVLKINFKVGEVLSLVATQWAPTLSVASLARTSGDLIVSQDTARKSVSTFEAEVMKRGKTQGWTMDLHHGEEMLMGYASVDMKIHTRVSTPGERKGISGETWHPVTWYVFVDIKAVHAFQPIRRLKQKNYFLLSCVILIVAVLAGFLTRSIIHPVEILQDGAARIQDGDLSHVIRLDTKDELGRLATSLNTMARTLIESNTRLEAKVKERTRALEMRKEAEKMGALNTLTAGIAHELNNPMMGILNFAQYCLKHTDSEDRRFAVLVDTVREVTRCSDIVRNLLTFTRVDDPGKEDFQQESLVTVIDRVFRLLAYRTEKENVNITRNIEKDTPPIRMKITDIQQVFLHLVGNALDGLKTSPEKKLHIRTGLIDGGMVETLLTDTGEGIDPGIMEKIFDPFYTTKPPGKGTGLGLSVSRSIVENHGGRITCESKKNKGATFRVLLPIGGPGGA